MFQLRTTSRKDDSRDEFLLRLFMSVRADFSINLLDDFHHAGMNDLRKVFQRNLFRLASTKPRDRNNFIVFIFSWPSRSEFYFQQFSLFLYDGATFFDVVGDDVSSEWNHGSMPDDTIFENSKVCSSTSNVDQRHTGFLLFLTQHRIRRCKRLQGKSGKFDASTLDATSHIAD